MQRDDFGERVEALLGFASSTRISGPAGGEDIDGSLSDHHDVLVHVAVQQRRQSRALHLMLQPKNSMLASSPITLASGRSIVDPSTLCFGRATPAGNVCEPR